MPVYTALITAQIIIEKYLTANQNCFRIGMQVAALTTQLNEKDIIIFNISAIVGYW